MKKCFAKIIFVYTTLSKHANLYYVQENISIKKIQKKLITWTRNDMPSQVAAWESQDCKDIKNLSRKYLAQKNKSLKRSTGPHIWKHVWDTGISSFIYNKQVPVDNGVPVPHSLTNPSPCSSLAAHPSWCQLSSPPCSCGKLEIVQSRLLGSRLSPAIGLPSQRSSVVLLADKNIAPRRPSSQDLSTKTSAMMWFSMSDAELETKYQILKTEYYIDLQT